MARASKPYGRPSRLRGSDGEWLHDKAPEMPPAVLNSSASTKLMISNLHYELTAKDLTQIFGQVGTLVREPLIRYDRSGRSSGVAIVSFETEAEAAAAKNRFDKKLAKGQPMSIEFYQPQPPRRPTRRGQSAPPSLIHRIEKAPLLDRLSKDEPKRQQAPATGPGPVRTRARGAAKPARVPKKAKTAEELDFELDAFMKDDTKPAEAPAAAPATVAEEEGDVEMA
ncbi:RNA-binding domain-containing protein [Laetiporus sulphureus 93-53]|uniref:RNA-binding domain-containing protein n=1 Tax=Laetiporus sulphureus 93-53 TaxID=1314785 RepID=A0A165CZF4_9APHY|nr:RNA-binding domain-containing protein [Laetiporus sulphureus 93-53]KZT03810.1 RNA-binding domain-containing protein [Laetiporus sulphureus 93-53]